MLSRYCDFHTLILLVICILPSVSECQKCQTGYAQCQACLPSDAAYTESISDSDITMGPSETLGEQRVRISFNPANAERGGEVADRVREIKVKSAELIDLCEALKPEDPRLASLAQTAYEEAAMWAVKAATAA
ncbi:Acb2/Tad1 domain-containing protein [Hyphomicrobium sp. DMF-1]|jgi:hypothetical protein|uniref:Acb2/Tad1 domain-containing protein n=1 Tax=Hyphomicrobium sp. DMF-1 TaxID=3019544 RepID=UPI0022EBE990|nr:hypothetical protein [Hyphomicrobium sp. DMF-1]WBT37114.1 hypothetical protein PE058_15805 [Hyphomicrobium sp. DMF-1]